MSTKFSFEVVDKLLDGLANDDDFRAEFERDPRAALSSIGHTTPAENVGIEGKDPVLPFLKLKGGLASKDKIKAGKDRMAKTYRETANPGVSGAIFAQFDFCAD